jgi:PucR family transcriptional regulator, purine catabolism regulatory protein
MATLGELQQALFPDARVLGAPRLTRDRAAREVSWVRVMKSRVPVFEALDPGDLAVIPGQALAAVAAATGTQDLVAALARTRIPGILLVGGDDEGGSFGSLGTAAVELGLTVLRVDRDDPVALERSVIGFLVNQRAELDRQAEDLQRDLARLALRGHGLDALAAAIGAALGRGVAIEGPHGDRLALHVPADRPGAAAAVTRYLARPSNVAMRTEIPAPADEETGGGALVLLGADPANEFERIAAERIVPLLALELARADAVRQAREETRRADPLPAEGPPWVVLLAGQGVASGPDALEAREAVRAGLRRLLPESRLTLRGTAESLELRLVAAATADDPAGLATAERVAAFIGRPVAVSRPFVEAGARPAAEAATRATLEAGEPLGPAPAVLRAERLPAYLLLGNLHNLPDGLRDARDLLASILVGPAATQATRLATLRAVLGSPSLGDAADRLGIHRNTIAYRVERLEALGGWDLADADLRFALEIAVRLVHDAQDGT